MTNQIGVGKFNNGPDVVYTAEISVSNVLGTGFKRENFLTIAALRKYVRSSDAEVYDLQLGGYFPHVRPLDPPDKEYLTKK